MMDGILSPAFLQAACAHKSEEEEQVVNPEEQTPEQPEETPSEEQPENTEGE